MAGAVPAVGLNSRVRGPYVTDPYSKVKILGAQPGAIVKVLDDAAFRETGVPSRTHLAPSLRPHTRPSVTPGESSCAF